MSAEHTGLMISRMESRALGQRCSIEAGGIAVGRAHNYLLVFQVNFRTESC